MQHFKKRLLSEKLERLSQLFPVVVVVGARQVGKSTLLKHDFSKAQYVVFDPVQDIENARMDPELFLNNHTTPLVLDEIQYAPEVVSVIKRRVDKDPSPGQYLLTGSQQWGVLKSMAESLAGRAVFLDLQPFSLSEIQEVDAPISWLERWLNNPKEVIKNKPRRLQNPPQLYEQLWRGFFPKAQELPFDAIPSFYQSYLRTYIERDVRVLADIDDLQTFGNFVKLAATLTAQEVNYSKLGKDIGITPQTAKRWLDILISTFQWFSLPAYSNNAIKKISNKPKGYFADTGLVCQAQAISTPQALGGHPLLGALFETAVIGELKKLSSAMASPPNLYHWRAHSGAEVDVILERDGKLYPIEIKSKSRPNKSDAQGLTLFHKNYPRSDVQYGLVICPCDEFFQLSSAAYAMPWDCV